MKRKNRNNLKLGLFVASGLILFVLGIYYLGKMQNLFQSNITVLTEFSDVKGLQPGNSVRFMGINVGTVMDISILSDTAVIVEMGIDKEISQFIAKDAQVEIDNEGVMGSKIIVIKAGTEGADAIKEMDVLQSFISVSYEDILNELESTASLTNLAAVNLLEVTEKINNGTGDMAKLINEDILSQNMNTLSSDLFRITSQAEEILQKANEGDNDIAALLNKNTLTQKLMETLSNFDTTSENLKATSIELLTLSKDIQHGDGIVQKLLYDTTISMEMDTAVHGLNNGIDVVVETADAIKSSWIITLFSGKKKKKKR